MGSQVSRGAEKNPVVVFYGEDGWRRRCSRAHNTCSGAAVNYMGGAGSMLREGDCAQKATNVSGGIRSWRVSRYGLPISITVESNG